MYDITGGRLMAGWIRMIHDVGNLISIVENFQIDFRNCMQMCNVHPYLIVINCFSKCDKIYRKRTAKFISKGYIYVEYKPMKNHLNNNSI